MFARDVMFALALASRALTSGLPGGDYADIWDRDIDDLDLYTRDIDNEYLDERSIDDLDLYERSLEDRAVYELYPSSRLLSRSSATTPSSPSIDQYGGHGHGGPSPLSPTLPSSTPDQYGGHSHGGPPPPKIVRNPSANGLINYPGAPFELQVIPNAYSWSVLVAGPKTAFGINIPSSREKWHSTDLRTLQRQLIIFEKEGEALSGAWVRRPYNLRADDEDELVGLLRKHKLTVLDQSRAKTDEENALAATFGPGFLVVRYDGESLGYPPSGLVL